MLFLSPPPDLVVGHTTVLSSALVLAHQGGWDEILMVLVPVSVFAALLYVANQRAGRLAARDGSASADADGTTDDGADHVTPPAPAATPPRPVPKNDRRGPV